MEKLGSWFKNLSLIGRISVLSAVTIGGLFMVSATSTPATTNNIKVDEIIPTTQVVDPVITTKQEVKTESVPFKKTTIDDSNLPKGQTKIQTAGVDGVKTITYIITLTDGVESNRTSTENITTEPIDEVTAIGTYAKPVSNCDPNYSGCVPIASDVDCSGGSGNGPAYTRGPVQVIGTDIYDLDRDGDGWGCE